MTSTWTSIICIYIYIYNMSIFNCVDLFTSQDSCSGSRVLSRAFRSSVTCPCLSPVLLIVVARRSSPSCLACAVACLWGSFLVCTSFGFRQALLQGLAPHLLLPRLLLPGLGGLDLPPTFWMSSSSSPVTSSDIRALVAALEQLTLQVSDLVSRVEAQQPPSAVVDLGDWELIGLPELPFGFSNIEELSRLHQLRGPETGPPDTPSFLLDFACRELKGPSSSCYRRAHRAFRAGFWASVAIETHTPYQPSDPFGPPDKHWIVLRALAGKKPIRVGSKTDFRKFVANTPEEVLVAESFASLSEVAVFCAGAGIRVPPLQQWKGSSLSSQWEESQVSQSWLYPGVWSMVWKSMIWWRPFASQ